MGLEHPLFSVVLAPMVVFVVGILTVIQGAFSLILGFRGGGWGVGKLGVLSLLFGLAVLFHPLIGSVLLPFIPVIFMSSACRRCRGGIPHAFGICSS